MRKFLRGILAVFFSLLFLPDFVVAQDQEILTKLKISVNGQVYAITPDEANNKLYLGGNFTSASRSIPYLARVDATTGEPELNFPIVNGAVQTSLPDGNGGYYIGGNFTQVGNVARTYVAHIDASGQITDWAADLNLNGPVTAMDKDASNVYIAGDFTAFNQITNTSGVALNASDGLPAGTIPKVNGSVNTVVPDGSGGWYIGGGFTEVGGFLRSNVAHINSLGEVTSFFEGQTLNGEVTAMYFDSGKLYIGGSFTSVNSIPISYGAKISDDGIIDINMPAVNSEITKALPDGNGGWFIGGYFSRIGNEARSGLAHINSSGQVTDLFKNFNLSVYDMVLSNGILYVGGAFQHIKDGSPAQRQIKVATNGTIDENFPGITGNVTTSIPDGNGGFFIAGDFTHVGELPRDKIAHINASGQVTSFFQNQTIDGGINALALSDGVLYLAGHFKALNAFQTSFSKISNTGEPDTSFPTTDGQIYAAVSDGSGGWFIGGSFTRVGEYLRDNLAHILSDGSVSAWNPSPNSSVETLAVSGSTVYAGGSFNSIGGQSRQYLAALDATTGDATIWNPSPNSDVLNLGVSGSTVYVCGYFNSIGGQNRNYLAAIDATTGNATTWNPSPNSYVLSLSILGNTVYAGGSFNSIGGQNRNYLAAIDATTGNATTWNPSPNSQVQTLAVSGSTIYTGGYFTSIGEQSRNYLAALDATTGNATSWNPSPNGSVQTLAISASTIHAGGYFSVIGGQSRNYLAALDVNTGNATSWNPSPNNGVQALVISGSTVYAGGSFNSIGGQSRNYLAALDAATGNVTSWNPSPNSSVQNLAVAGSTIYAGGYFTNIGGQSRNYLAALDATTGNATSWNPLPNSQVQTLAVLGSTIYTGGYFSSIGGQSRQYLAALDATTGNATSWNPSPSSPVQTLTVSGSTVYAGGSFNSIGGQSRQYLAALDATTGTATNWNPSPNSQVQTLAVLGSTVYAGGHFTSIGGQSRNYLAALDATTGNATSWNPSPNNPVQVLSASGSSVYVGGYFSAIGSTVWRNLIAFEISSGNATSWNPSPNSYVQSLSILGNTVYAGGSFNSIGGQNRNYLAALDATTGNVTSWNPSPNGSVQTLTVSGSTIYAGGSFNSIGGQSRNYLAALDATTGNATSWNPSPNSQVQTLTISGSTIYAGGYFNTIGGQSRNNLAALDPVTGNATSWNPSPNNQVQTLAVLGSTVYAGGYFNSIGGQSRNYLAALDVTSGNATSWNPSPSSVVRSISVSGSAVYAGGSFNSIGGQSRNYLAALNATTGNPTSWNPSPNNQVQTLTVLGSTVYAGGYFNNIGGQTRNYLAALDATTGSAMSWNPSPSSYVQSLSISGNTVYAGGSFNSIGGQSRNYLAAIDATTGNATSWNPSPNSEVQTLAISGSTVYAGGSFNSIGGQSRNYLAALDATTGNATTWNPIPNGQVQALAASGSTIYAGGYFNNIGGQNRNYLAALDATTGNAVNWNPSPDNAVQALAASGSTVYAGGYFTSIGGQSRNYLAALDINTGNATSWNPSPTGIAKGGSVVKTLAVSGSTVYAGGSFTSIGGQSRNYLAAVDISTGNATSWDPSPDSQIQTLIVSGSTIYAGGSFNNIGGQNRDYLAALDATTGDATNWNPSPDDQIQTLVVSGSTIYAGGYFNSIGGQSRNYLAALDATTSNATSWDPSPNSVVRTLSISGTSVYAGGSFSSIGGQIRNYLAELDATTGETTTWNPSVSAGGKIIKGSVVVSTVNSSGSFTLIGGSFTDFGDVERRNLLCVDLTTGTITPWNPKPTGLVTSVVNDATTGKVYAAGNFTGAGGLVRNGLVELDATTGQATSWNAGVNNNGAIYSMGKINSSLLVTGEFSTIGGQSRSRIALLNLSNAQATSWNPGVNGIVVSHAVSGNSLYIGGIFTKIGNTTRNNIGAIDLTTGVVLPWNPSADNGVYSITKAGSTIYAGGQFTSIGGQSRSNLAALEETSGNATSWDPAPDGPILAVAASGNTVYAGGQFNVISGKSRSNLAAIDRTSGAASNWNPAPNSSINLNALKIVSNTIYVGGNFSSINTMQQRGISGLSLSITGPELDLIDSNNTDKENNGAFDFGNVNMSSSSGDLTFVIKNPGTEVVELGSLLISGTHSSDFTITQPATTTVDPGMETTFSIKFTPSTSGIRTAQLTISSNDADENPFVLNLTGTGVKLDQTITFNTLTPAVYGVAPFTLTATTTSPLSVSYVSDNPSVATISGNTVTIVGPGSAKITASQAGNQTYNAAPSVEQTLVVTKAALVVKADDKTKVYGAANPGLTITYTGFVNGDNASAVTAPTLATTATAASGVNTYPITLTGGTSSKYELTLQNGTLTVTKAQLTVKADDKTKVYGSANPALTITYTGFVNGDNVSAVTTPALATSATTSSGANTYPITVSGGSAANYDLLLQNGVLTITKAQLTVKADDKSKVYGSANPTLTITYTGFVNGDSESGLTTPTLATTATTASGVNAYLITLSGGLAANYDLLLQNGTLTVTKASLTAKADDKSKIYGSANPTLTITYTGFVNGDNASTLTVPTIATSATTSSSVNTYPITLSGGVAVNYDISLQNGTLTVTKASLTAKADNKSKVYGSANPALTITYTGFVNGDNASAITIPGIATTATASSGVNTYPITLSGGASGNYDLTLQNGSLTITKASLTAKADNKTKIYGSANPALTITYTGFVNGDNASAITAPSTTTSATTSSGVNVYPITLSAGSAANYDISLQDGTLTVTKASLTAKADNKTKVYGSANPTLTLTYTGFVNGDNSTAITVPVIATTATGPSGVNTYPITLSGGSAANYNISLQDGTLTVTKASLTAKADNKTKVYGSANPTLTLTYTGFVNGDNSSVLTAPAIATAATVSSDVNTYPITLSGGSASNYDLFLQDGTLTITKASLTVKADNKTKVYGSVNPPLTITYTGFVNGDNSSAITAPAISTAATTSSGVNTYPITFTGGSSANYDLTLQSGTLTVTKASLTAKAEDKTKVYGSVNPVLTVMYTGFVNGDNAGSITSPSVSTVAVTSSTVNVYPIVLTGGSATNYDLILDNGILTVTPATLLIRADDKSKVYGTANPDFTITYSGFVNSDTESSIIPPSVSSVATISSDAGQYPITPSGGSSANYLFSYQEGILTITKASQTIQFAEIPSKSVNDLTFSLDATSSSGLVVSYESSNGSVATISGNTVTIMGEGTTEIAASQSGDLNYEAAPIIVRTLTVTQPKGDQTISFDEIVDKTLGDSPFTIVAAASSGLPVEFASSSSKISLSGSTVTMLEAGRVTILANQSGNTLFNSAPEVSRSFCINPVKPVITLSGENSEAIQLSSSSEVGNQWYLNGVAINGETNATYSVLEPGVYTLTVAVDNCTSAFSDAKSIVITGFEEDKILLKVYPNPASEILHIEFPGSAGKERLVFVYDMQGRIKEQIKTSASELEIDIKEYPVGAHILSIHQSGKVRYLKFVKQ